MSLTKKKLKRSYNKEENRHEKAYEKENTRHEKKHIVEMDEAFKVCANEKGKKKHKKSKA